MHHRVQDDVDAEGVARRRESLKVLVVFGGTRRKPPPGVTMMR
jgi:hypothetical protein